MSEVICTFHFVVHGVFCTTLERGPGDHVDCRFSNVPLPFQRVGPVSSGTVGTKKTLQRKVAFPGTLKIKTRSTPTRLWAQKTAKVNRRFFELTNEYLPPSSCLDLATVLRQHSHNKSRLIYDTDRDPVAVISFVIIIPKILLVSRFSAGACWQRTTIQETHSRFQTLIDGKTNSFETTAVRVFIAVNGQQGLGQIHCWSSISEELQANQNFIVHAQ
jgi:hypothetical protein